MSHGNLVSNQSPQKQLAYLPYFLDANRPLRYQAMYSEYPVFIWRIWDEIL